MQRAVVPSSLTSSTATAMLSARRGMFAATTVSLRWRPHLFEAPLDKQVENSQKGPVTAHNLPVY